MRLTLDSLDPLPANPAASEFGDVLLFGSASLSLDERRFRLPSSRQMVLEHERNEAIDRAAKKLLPIDGLPKLVEEFNRGDLGKARGITEADCQQKKARQVAPAGSDGWTEWNGEGAVPATGSVDVRLRNGQEFADQTIILWRHTGEGTDVVAYRIASKPKAEEPKADAEGWILHDGSDRCPLPNGTRYQYRWSGLGDQVFPIDCPAVASAYRAWDKVTEYRVVNPAQ